MIGAYLLTFITGTLIGAGMLAAAFKPSALPLTEGEPTQRRRYTAAGVLGGLGIVLPSTFLNQFGIDNSWSAVFKAWQDNNQEIMSGKLSLMAFIEVPTLVIPSMMSVVAVFCLIYIYRKPTLFANYAGGGMYATTESVRAWADDESLTLSFQKKIDGAWVTYNCVPAEDSDDVTVSVHREPLEDVNALTQKSGRAGNDN